ncbi:MAG: YraN family protein, partial [Lachnospiraceae bacterium]|nr:YraN family protein [Lachnospiraceae bacterium]
MNLRKIGAEKEQQAANYLEAHGLRVVERNFRGRGGEVDIIGYHEGYLVFVEVKYRSSNSKGTALEAVGHQKQRQVCKVADYYRYLHR